MRSGLAVIAALLLALSLVIGVLVDDAIVEVENIERHLNMGKTPYQAAMEAADTPNFSSIALMSSESSRTVIDEILSRISVWAAALMFLLLDREV